MDLSTRELRPFALTWLLALTLLLVAAGGTAGAAAEETAKKAPAEQELKPVKIERLYWMVHPVCWGLHGGGIPEGYLEAAGVTAEDFYYTLEWERRVNEEQKQFMSSMKPNEALIIYPISRSAPMLDLEQHAEKTLGRRCLIINRVVVAEPSVLHGMDDPIRRFLEDEQMEGRDAFWNQAPKAIQDEVRAEIIQACQSTGYNWNPSALKVIMYNRLLAQDIKDMFVERKLSYDPTTLRGVAFGEGFEQCAMTWKALIPGYMGLTYPIENNFELSVSGAPMLFGVTLKEYVTLPNNVRLFLWEKADGRMMALYYRAAVNFADPQLFAHVPIDGLSLEAWGVVKKRWPIDDSPLELEHGEFSYLKVPVFATIRKHLTDESFYLIAKDVSFEQFRDVLVNARISEAEIVEAPPASSAKKQP
jgi:hypothetical protein